MEEKVQEEMLILFIHSFIHFLVWSLLFYFVLELEAEQCIAQVLPSSLPNFCFPFHHFTKSGQ